MPGSALWLVPPPHSPIERTLTKLIQRLIPALLPSTITKTYPLTLPHLTLTSSIPDTITDSSPARRRAWLDSLPCTLPTLPTVRFQSVDVGERVTQKLTLSVAREASAGSLVELAVGLRARAVEGGDRKTAEKWARGVWEPHVSLLYAEGDVSEEKRLEVSRVVVANGVELGEADDAEKQKGEAVWEGGQVVWVDTRGEISGWEVIGTRDLDIVAT